MWEQLELKRQNDSERYCSDEDNRVFRNMEKCHISFLQFILYIQCYCSFHRGIFSNCHMSVPTSDVEHGLVAEASVGSVDGNTAENASVYLPHASHLENPLGKESVSGQEGEIRLPVSH